jgi:tetratricopeptide (TPR) repeat protein
MKLVCTATLVFLLLFSVRLFSQDDEVLILKPAEEPGPVPRDSSANQFPTPETDLPGEAYQDFYNRWRQFELQLKLGSVDQNLINEIVRQRNRMGIPKITELSLSALQYGQVKLKENNPEQALQLFRASTTLDPTMSAAYYSQASALIAQSWTKFPAAIRLAFIGMFAPLNNLNGKIYLASKYAFIITATLLVLGFAFALILLTKYQRLLRHDTMERYTSLSTTTINLLVWIVLFLPVFLLAGILWLAPFWLMVFWKYARNSERILSVLFFFSFMIAYPVYHYAAKVSAVSTESSITPFVRMFSDGPSPRLLSDFRDYVIQYPEDPNGTIMLAHLYRIDRNYADSIRVLQKHILDHPEDARALNNLGHIYFLQGETDIGLRMVQKAEDLDGRSAIYPYNLSILHRAKFNFSIAEEALDKARRLEPDFVRSLEENPYTGLVDSIPTASSILSGIQIRAGAFTDYLMNPFTGASLGLLLLAILRGVSFSRRTGHAKECIKCGRPFCKRCQPAVKELKFCTQCLHIFVKKDGVSPASRKDKMREIEDYSRKQEAFLKFSSLLLPGFSNLYKNRIWFGTVLLFFWFLFLILLFYNWQYSNSSFYEVPGSTTVLPPFFVLLLVLLYLVANISLIRRAKA